MRLTCPGTRDVFPYRGRFEFVRYCITFDARLIANRIEQYAIIARSDALDRMLKASSIRAHDLFIAARTL